MRVAVVGAAGQVGGSILRRLAKRPGVSVFGITRNEFSAEPLRYEGFEIRVGSVFEAGGCRRLLDSSDLIINAALQIELPRSAREGNETILRNLLKHEKSGLVVHCSTIAVYGSCLERSFSTFAQPRGDSTYAREKLRIERFAADIARKCNRRLAILRLGHVYGPSQGHSKEFFARLSDPRWRLPFNGDLPSNTVHIWRLADSIPELFDSVDGVEILNAVNAPQMTWRQVYDLHARAAGLPVAPGMSHSESVSLRMSFCARARRRIAGRLASDVSEWVRSLPFKALADAYGVREAMDWAMLRLPRTFERAVYARYQAFSAEQQISTGKGVVPPPWYFSDPVPGPNFLEQTTRDDGVESDEEIRELSSWFSIWAMPTWRVPVSGQVKPTTVHSTER